MSHLWFQHISYVCTLRIKVRIHSFLHNLNIDTGPYTSFLRFVIQYLLTLGGQSLLHSIWKPLICWFKSLFLAILFSTKISLKHTIKVVYIKDILVRVILRKLWWRRLRKYIPRFDNVCQFCVIMLLSKNAAVS